MGGRIWADITVTYDDRGGFTYVISPRPAYRPSAKQPPSVVAPLTALVFVLFLIGLGLMQNWP